MKKSRIRETSNLLTDADRRTDTILESLRDLSEEEMGNFIVTVIYYLLYISAA